MRFPLVAIALLAAAHPVRAAAQAPDSIPSSAVVIEEKDLTVKPELTNRPAIARLLTRSYPQALRDEGRSARVTVTMVIDPAGVPRLATVTGNSGIAEFDDAALRVVRAMRFSAPVKDGAPVWVRVVVPVDFSRTP